MVLAIKFLDDDLCSHTHYAKVGGVTTAALHELEMRTFAALDYRLRVAPAELFIVLDQVRHACLAKCPPCRVQRKRTSRFAPVHAWNSLCWIWIC